MKKKIIYLGVGYVALYYLLRVAYRLPSLIHGSGRWLHGRMTGFLPRAEDLAIGFCFTLLPYIILNDYYPVRKIVKGVLLIAVSLCLTYFLGFWLESHVGNGVRLRLRDHFNDHFFFYGLYTIYGIAYYFIQYAQHKELEQQELLMRNQQAELSFLRSQINPHFLFNNLNNIYTLVYYKSEQALAAIAALSDLLRFMLYDTSEMISLEKEIVYLEKYVDLQKLRFEGPVPVEMSIDKDTCQWQVPPLLLIPFLENAFKHGVVADGRGIRLRLRILPGELNFYCTNKKGHQQKDDTGGVGLENIKRRLGLLYPGKHELRIEDGEDEFTVNLLLKNG